MRGRSSIRMHVLDCEVFNVSDCHSALVGDTGFDGAGLEQYHWRLVLVLIILIFSRRMPVDLMAF